MDILINNIVFKAGWLMVPIIAGSVLALAITIERWVYYWRIKLNVEDFSDEIFFLVEKGEINRAIEKCDKIIHPIGFIFNSVLKQIGTTIPNIERIMEREGGKQIAFVEKNLNYLMAITGVEPMLGFLGTIVGLIKAFMIWEQYSTSVTVDQLAAGIYQAMITTAAGLMVAIPFYLIYNYFNNKSTKILQDFNYFGDKLIEIISIRKEKGDIQ